jgi:hypothetical protein
MPNRRDLLATVAALVLVATAQAQDPVQGVSAEITERVLEAKSRLGLTPRQEDKLQPLVEERNQKLKAIRDKYAGDTSRAARRSMFREAKPVQADYDTKVRAILTGPQEKEWEAMRKEAAQRMVERYRSGQSPE